MCLFDYRKMRAMQELTLKTSTVIEKYKEFLKIQKGRTPERYIQLKIELESDADPVK